MNAGNSHSFEIAEQHYNPASGDCEFPNVASAEAKCCRCSHCLLVVSAFLCVLCSGAISNSIPINPFGVESGCSSFYLYLAHFCVVNCIDDLPLCLCLTIGVLPNENVLPNFMPWWCFLVPCFIALGLWTALMVCIYESGNGNLAYNLGNYAGSSVILLYAIALYAIAHARRAAALAQARAELEDSAEAELNRRTALGRSFQELGDALSLLRTLSFGCHRTSLDMSAAVENPSRTISSSPSRSRAGSRVPAYSQSEIWSRMFRQFGPGVLFGGAACVAFTLFSLPPMLGADLSDPYVRYGLYAGYAVIGFVTGEVLKLIGLHLDMGKVGNGFSGYFAGEIVASAMFAFAYRTLFAHVSDWYNFVALIVVHFLCEWLQFPLRATPSYYHRVRSLCTKFRPGLTRFV